MSHLHTIILATNAVTGEWYATYQKIPTVVDEGIERSGGKRITERVALDVAASNVFDALDDWSEKALWPALGSKSIEDADARELKLEIDMQGRSTALKQDMKHGEVVETRLLTTKEGAPRKRHIGIRLPSGVSYRAGDYLAILPMNPPETVKRVMKRFSLPWDAMVKIDKSAVTTLPKDKQLSVHDILSAMVELSQPVTAKLVATLTKCLADEKQSQELQALAKDDKKLKGLTLLALLEKYPSAEFSFGAFLAAMPAMRVRQYSISSSPLSDPSIATLTWSVLDAPDKSGRTHGNFLGVCSTYLERLSPGDWVQIALRPSRTGFQPPSDDTSAMIMACAGTGLAPFRAFVSERAIKKSQGAAIGPALLFYGAHAPDEDDMYKEEFDAWEQQGVVSVRRAFSAAPEQTKGCKHVQDRIWEDREEVADMFRNGAHVYLCGAGIVGIGVEQAMARIRCEQKGCSEEEAKAWVAEQKGGRYWADVFS
jgi:cytochrome P450/NADPH-cytochrome P450 reductase